MTDTSTTTPANIRPDPPRKKRRWLLPLAFGAMGMVGGLVLATVLATAPTDTAEYKAVVTQKNDVSIELNNVQGQLDSKSSDLTQTQSDLQTAQGRVASLTGHLTKLKAGISGREAAAKHAEEAVGVREKAVTAAEHAVAKRERAVGLAETRIQKNTVSDGVYEVGIDMKPGTYKTDGASGCYYAVLRSANTNDIVNNSIEDGPTVVSVSDGQYLELDCSGADWVLQQ
jgi:hypothetical protein